MSPMSEPGQRQEVLGDVVTERVPCCDYWWLVCVEVNWTLPSAELPEG